jgi:hypothetical protein
MTQLFEEVAKIGRTYCEYNQALISLQNLTQAQKIQIVKALIEDIYTTATETYEGDI